MLKLWGRKNSSNTKKIMWACAEMGVPYERIDAGLQFGINDSEDFRQRLNPNGLVPVIDDDGFILWESNAILRYLCAKHGRAPFWPDDPQQRASADRWLDYQTSTLSPALGLAFQQIMRFPPEQRDMKMIQTNIPRTNAIWKIIDQQLARTRWLAGDHLTFGDLPFAIHCYTWKELALERVGLEHVREELPNVNRWYAQLQENPHYRDIVMIGLT